MDSVKVVQVSNSFGVGGAGIAAMRLHRAMLKRGIQSTFVCSGTYSGASPRANNLFFTSMNGKLFRAKELFFGELERLFSQRKCVNRKLAWSDARFGVDIAKLPALADADIIYLHWLNLGFLSLDSIENILRLGKPVFWVMHDMWAFTGGCHYSFDCQKYETGCSRCPLLKKSGPRDDSFKNFCKKQKALGKYRNLQIITPSRWLGECVKSSAIFPEIAPRVIHNPLDRNLFKVLDRGVARQLFNFPENRKLILFGADAGTDNPYKGWEFLKAALGKLDRDDVELVIFGSEYDQRVADQLKFKVHFMGRITDEQTLVMLYNAVDLFVTPSLADNWPSTIIEANCCGIPVVAFEVGGIANMIRMRQNGYLAKLRDADDLAAGIAFALSHPWDRNAILDWVGPLVDEDAIVRQHRQLWAEKIPTYAKGK